MDSPDVVCIVETWLDGEICDQELVIDGYTVLSDGTEIDMEAVC